MNLPIFWRRAAFSVAESADILSVPHDTLRTWAARCPFNDFIGAKTGGRIFLSGVDLFFWSLIRDLSAYGVGLRIAMQASRAIAESASYELPDIDCLVVRKTGPDIWEFDITDEPDITSSSVLVIPPRALATSLISICSQVYAEEAK